MRDGAIFSSKEGNRIPQPTSPGERKLPLDDSRFPGSGMRPPMLGFGTPPERSTSERPPALAGERPPGDQPPGERSPGDRSPGDRFGADRRMYNPYREAERLKRELGIRSTTDADSGRSPIFYTIFKYDGSIFKSQDDPLENRNVDALDARLGSSREPIFYDAVAKRQVLFRGPERSIILAGVSQEEEMAHLQTLLNQLLGIGGFALLGCLIGSWFISGKLLEPLKKISTTASRISATNLGERIDTSKVEKELVELTTALNASLDRLEGAFQRQSRFTADAGHELRTPLAILHANLELALSRPRSGDEYREIVQQCLESSSKMRSLIDALLMLARADAGQLQANFMPLDLGSVVKNSVHQHLSKAKRIQLHYSVPEQPVMISGDPVLLGMVLSNLIQNALRHTHDDGYVKLSIEVENQIARMTVADNGIGIPYQDQPMLFERFYRADASRNRNTGGHGLGLAICKSLIEAHYGVIACESVPGEGTRFIMHLPMVDYRSESS